MVKLILLLSTVNILVVSDNCIPCNKAKHRLRNENILILDISEAGDFNIKTTPTFIVIRNNKEVSRAIGLLTLRQYKALMNTSFGSNSFTGAIYFKGPDDIITSGIKRRIKRFGFTIKIGTPEQVKQYKITHLPTFIFIEKGKEIGRYVGVKER